MLPWPAAALRSARCHAGCHAGGRRYIAPGVSGEVAEWLKALAWKACIRETVSWVRIPPSPPRPFPKPFSGALEPQAKGIIGGFLPHRPLHLNPYRAGQKHSPGRFFSRPLYFRSMIRFSEDRKRMVLRMRFHVPEFESRSLSRARRKMIDHSLI